MQLMQYSQCGGMGTELEIRHFWLGKQVHSGVPRPYLVEGLAVLTRAADQARSTGSLHISAQLCNNNGGSQGQGTKSEGSKLRILSLSPSP